MTATLEMQRTYRRSIEEGLESHLRLDSDGAGELLLVRHAEAVRTAAIDPMLSCTGLVQAERLGERLNAARIGAVYSAPERRAQQTARVIAGLAGRELQVIDGCADIQALAGRDSRPVSQRAIERFSEVPRWDSLPWFEPGVPFRRRVVQSIEGVLAAHPAERVVVVTHASAINAYLSMILGVPADAFFMPEPSSLSVIRWRAGQYALRCLNDLSHLSNDLEMPGGSDIFYGSFMDVNSALKRRA